MKTKLQLSSIALAMILSFTACEKSNDPLLEEQVVSSTPTIDAALPEETPTNQKLVAKIQKDGHEYTFLKFGADSENNILITEKLYGSEEAKKDLSLFTINDNSTPFDVFIRITDNNVAIPSEIAKTIGNHLIEASKRNISNSKTTLEILDPNYEDYPYPVDDTACTDVGDTEFLEEYCGVPIISLPNDISYCDSNRERLVGRSTRYGGQWKELTNTILLTNVVCGITRIQFYGWDGLGSWVLEAQVDYPDGVYSTKYTTSRKTERYVRRSRPYNDGGSFRSYTRFVDAD